ncbi:MAG: CPBP family intramembrane glutamic endopeptidase [Pseudomonadota bacterium]
MTSTPVTPDAQPTGRYVAASEWRGVTAFLATLGVFGVSAGVGIVVALGIERLTGWAWFALPQNVDHASANGPYGFFLVSQMGLQIVSVLLILWIAGRYGAKRADVLALKPVEGGAWTYFKAFGVVLLVSMAYSWLVYAIAPDTILQDVKPYMGMLRSDAAWLLAVIVIIGAPLSEELLFRGFLLSALAKTPLGFVGASIISTGLWAVLHAQYSVAGLIAVFVLGLAFCWLLWRTGSLWVPIVCHGLYNATVLLVVWGMANGVVAVPN